MRWREFQFTTSVVENSTRFVRRQWQDGVLLNPYYRDNVHEEHLIRAQTYMQDVVGNRLGDNPWHFEQNRAGVWSVSGNYSSIRELSAIHRIEDTTTVSWAEAAPFGLLHPAVEIDDTIFATKAVAGTNPSRATVQGLVFVAELRQLPSLLMTSGQTMAKLGANEYLKVQYGWKPFVKDCIALFSTASRIRKRVKLLNRLNKVGVQRSNWSPEYGSRQTYVDSGYSARIPFEVEGARIRLHVTQRHDTKRWAQVIWRPDALPDNLLTDDDDRQFEIAKKAIYGLNLDGPSLWQAMPWSWLIDWVHNTSDYIESQNNTVGASYKDVILMRDMRSYVDVVPVVEEFDTGATSVINALSTQAGRSSSRTRVRLTDLEPEVVSKYDGASSILGDGFKLSILGALGVQRLKGI